MSTADPLSSLTVMGAAIVGGILAIVAETLTNGAHFLQVSINCPSRGTFEGAMAGWVDSAHVC